MNKFLFILFLIFSFNFSFKAFTQILVMGDLEKNFSLECAFYIEGEISNQTYLDFLKETKTKSTEAPGKGSTQHPKPIRRRRYTSGTPLNDTVTAASIFITGTCCINTTVTSTNYCCT